MLAEYDFGHGLERRNKLLDSISKTTEIARLFFEIGKALRHTMSKNFGDIGFTGPQGMVMSTLTKYGEMKITELSRKMNLSNSTTSGIIDRLEKQQFVIRTRSEQDRRIVYVKASPMFDKIHKELHKNAEKGLEELLSSGTPEEIEKILEGLNAFKKILKDKHNEFCGK